MNLRVIDRDNDDIIGLTVVHGHSSAQFSSLAARSVSTRDVRRLMSAQMCADVYASRPLSRYPRLGRLYYYYYYYWVVLPRTEPRHTPHCTANAPKCIVASCTLLCAAAATVRGGEER